MIYIYTLEKVASGGVCVWDGFLYDFLLKIGGINIFPNLLKERTPNPYSNTLLISGR